MHVSNGGDVTINLSAAEAEQLRRVCNFNVTVGDRVSANSGAEAGKVYKSFLYNLGSQLRSKGIKRG